MEPRQTAPQSLTRAALADMDRQLALQARGEGRLCLQLGEYLERFARLGGPHSFGYSGRGYYATQVIGRGARWAGDLCALARRLEVLPLTRAALATGLIGLSMARLLAKHAEPETEAELLLASKGQTVRAMKTKLEAGAADTHDSDEKQERSTIEVTVPTLDAWAYEYVRILLDRGLGCRTRDQVIEGMLAEGALTLSLLDPDLGVPVAPPEHPMAKWRHERAAEEAEIEAELEHRVDLELDVEPLDMAPLPPLDSLSDDIYVLDREIRSLAEAFGRRDLELGELALRFWKADGWLMLGYTSEAQYCRERLGCSLSSLKQRMRLARNAAAMPSVTKALGEGAIGFEAAMLIVRTGRPEYAADWVKRAGQRTVLHLREEVEIAETHARLAGCSSHMAPPSDEAVADYIDARASVLSGKVFSGAGPESGYSTPRAARGRAIESPTTASCSVARSRGGGAVPPVGGRRGESKQDVEDESQMFGGPASDDAEPPRVGAGMRTLRLSMRDDLARWWRQLDRIWRRACCRLDLGGTFLEFLCLATVDAWRANIEEARHVKYSGAYARDGYRCSNPTCGRSDVTPHHLLFRSRGGGDEDANISSLCVCCHISLLHDRGSVRAEPPSDKTRWLLGYVPRMEVVGRVMKRVA